LKVIDYLEKEYYFKFFSEKIKKNKKDKPILKYFIEQNDTVKKDTTTERLNTIG